MLHVNRGGWSQTAFFVILWPTGSVDGEQRCRSYDLSDAPLNTHEFIYKMAVFLSNHDSMCLLRLFNVKMDIYIHNIISGIYSTVQCSVNLLVNNLMT